MLVTDSEIFNAIALHMDVEVADIVKVRELYKVYCVVVRGRRPRFVSKRKVVKFISLEWEIKLGSRQYNGWVAKLSGLCPRWGFQREFLEGIVTEWSRRKAETMKFTITEPGIYQDVDDDFFLVRIGAEGLEAKFICKDEAKALVSGRHHSQVAA